MTPFCVLRRSNVFDFQWHQYVSWRSLFFPTSLGSIWTMVTMITMVTMFTMRFANLVQTTRVAQQLWQRHGWTCLNMTRSSSIWTRYTTTGKTYNHGFLWFSMFFMMALRSSWSALVPPASEEVPSATELTLSSSLWAIWLPTRRTWTNGNRNTWCLW